MENNRFTFTQLGTRIPVGSGNLEFDKAGNLYKNFCNETLSDTYFLLRGQKRPSKTAEILKNSIENTL